MSLLAEIEGDAVGHILLTKANIVSRTMSVEALALAPLSVVPEHQARGVGKMLVIAAHQRATDLGFRIVILVGNSSYYPQFGYKALGSYPITLPFEAPDQNCMIFALDPHALEGVAGVVQYADNWLDH